MPAKPTVSYVSAVGDFNWKWDGERWVRRDVAPVRTLRLVYEPAPEQA